MPGGDPRSSGAAPARARGLRVAVTDAKGRPLDAAGLVRWLVRIAPARARGDITIALVSDRQVRDLNRRFRQIDRPTDVLSFPADDSASPWLGDIVIATGVARRQARQAGHTLDTELRILALHGLLHLLGYDHETDDGRMARAERRLRRRGGLTAGLVERSGT